MLTPTQNAFLQAAIPAAIATHHAFGVPASITIAQACLESGYGEHVPTGSFNCFGIKAAPGQPSVLSATHEVVRGVLQPVQAAFAKYASWTAGFAAHARLLTTAHYAPAMVVRNDPAAFAGALKACGYSTNPFYAQQLMTLVREFNLTQYDQQ